MPNQFYGLRFTSAPLLASEATGRYKIPTSIINPPANWNQPGFDDSSWTTGTGGFGFGQPGVAVR